MIVFGVTVFLSAALLFQVQMLFARHILPWYGGVPSVWTTCMLCFQVMLVAGYAYSHWLVHRLSPRTQTVVHVSLVTVSIGLVAAGALVWGAPLLPDGRWKPTPQDMPALHIVGLVAIALGIPFFVTATTSSLVQAWFAATFPAASTYRLYALSNLGSLLGLVSYPAIVERWLPLQAQAWGWAAGYALLAASITACGLVARRASRTAPVSSPALEAGPAPRLSERALWLLLAACPSALLLATTNYMSQEIAVIPFLWMLPLALYLLSFVFSFDRERWYVRRVWTALLVLGVTLSTLALERGIWAHVLLQTGIPALALFVACMVCHGELARLKPSARHLTTFYLALTAGGAAGGAFVAVAAPLLFQGTWEYPITLWIAAALALGTLARDATSPIRRHPMWTAALTTASGFAVIIFVFRSRLFEIGPDMPDAWLFGAPPAAMAAGFLASVLDRRRRATAAGSPGAGRFAVALGGGVAGLFALGVALVEISVSPVRNAIEHSRSFYGIVHVVDEMDEQIPEAAFKLRHGRIAHGQQFGAEDKRNEPTTYYGRVSGVALAIEHHPRRAEGLRVGVVGLGVGTLAAYGREGDTFRFYEINPDVIDLAGPAGRIFTYVRDSAAQTDVAVGDARLALEAELAGGTRQRFDVLAIDAFSSDAIPVHLLTREAVALYLEHLDAGGILAIHISNRYVELKPVIRGLARHFGLAHVVISSEKHELSWPCTWALLARDQARLAVEPITDAAEAPDADTRSVLWTDDYSNVLGLLKL